MKIEDVSSEGLMQNNIHVTVIVPVRNEKHNLKYFRLGQYKNFQTKTYESYTLRISLQHMYVSKI